MNRMGYQAYGRVQRGMLTALSVFLFTLPGYVGASGTDAIDETKPANIPAAIIDDWKAQDGTSYDALITSIKNSLPAKYQANVTGSGETGYLNACHWRRVARMQPYAKELKKLLYARHHDIGGAIIGYTEDLNSDGAKGLGQWGMTMSKSSDYSSGNSGGTAIHLLEFKDFYPSPTDLIVDSKGCLRDPCPTYDGKKVVFAWSKDNNGYSIFDIDMTTKTTRQLTDDPEGIKVSDMEPCVTPSGDIVFMSSRCFQHVDCNINLVSNLFLMDKDGKYLRRIGQDQVNTFYPTMREDGSVMYTRWEYNDRNVANCFGIFTMNQDGTRQNEFYGNQTGWPATFNQARSIPGSPMMAIATIGGHMGPYAGDLVRVNASKTRNGVSGVELIAPKRSTSGTSNPYNMDGVPDEDKLFQNPYPLSEDWFLVSYRTTRKGNFAIYLMDINGSRELVAYHASQSVSQPISLMERPIPIVTQFQADYSKDKAYSSVVDVYYGKGTEGVTKGSIKKIRVCAMEYRTDPAFGNTGAQSYQMGPVARFGGSWEAKWIVGEVDVAADGSAAFEVPPNTPVFLQLIDADGVCVQTMRSWMTLMPGERFDCMGCHEDKNAAPLTTSPTAKTPVALKPFLDVGQVKGSFHFNKVIQPILDKNCNKSGCHDAANTKLALDSKTFWTNDLDDADNKTAYRYWSNAYYNLSASKYVNCNAVFGGAEGIRPKSIGSARSALMTKLKTGTMKDKCTAEEFAKLCAWVDLSIPYSGTYTDDMKPEDQKNYEARMQRRIKEEAVEAINIAQFVKDGGYDQPHYRILTGVKPEQKSAVSRVNATNVFKARFLTAERMLSLELPSEGQVRMLDLMGRQILSKEISRDEFVQSAAHTIKLSVPAGTYIVKFNGVKVTSEQVLSVL